MEKCFDGDDIVGYADETGHSKDNKQRFNGIAGLIAPASGWKLLDEKWSRSLKEFKISHFHAKDFAAFKGEFEGWSELKRKKLLGKLLRHIAEIRPLPVGSILCMDDFTSVAERHRQRFPSLPDPYHLAFGGLLGFITGFIEQFGNPNQRALVVFSNQVEFRNEAFQYYEEICKTEPLLKRRIRRPTFGDMKALAPLQAADLVAYELYKEYELMRGFRTAAGSRHGYKELLKLGPRLGFNEPMFMFQTRADIANAVTTSITRQRKKRYWQRRKQRTEDSA